jgi:hypothetical protein
LAAAVRSFLEIAKLKTMVVMVVAVAVPQLAAQSVQSIP